MRKQVTFLSLMAVLALVRAEASDGRELIVRALRAQGFAERVEVSQVRAGTAQIPENARVARCRFDSSTKTWVVELKCPVKTPCVPVLAMIDAEALVAQPWRRGTQPPIVIRPGARRLLTSTAGPISITEQVVCLQTGRPGDRVRVRVVGNGKLKQAVVSETGQLVLAPAL